MTTEYRYVAGCELRLDDERRQLMGIVMPYNTVSPHYHEIFEPGAFGDLDKADVMLNAMHQRPQPLARTGAGLQLVDTREHLRMTATLPHTRVADDTLELVRGGILRGLSVEFHSLQEHKQGSIRVVTRAKLTGIGVVDKPGYDDAVVEARSAQKRRRRLWL